MLWLSTAYLPPISYMAALVQERQAKLEAAEHFVKQSYRSRCRIFGPNGVQTLSVPVDRSGWRSEIKHLEISYAENWPDKHWRALEAAYNSSPFFSVLGDDILRIYQKRPKYLFELNKHLLAVILDWLQDEEISIEKTTDYVHHVDGIDLRERIHPKKESLLIEPPAYYQQFGQKHGIQSDLSVIDLIFHEGRAAWDYLNEVKLDIKKTASR
jgi:hypothetical protein